MSDQVQSVTPEEQSTSAKKPRKQRADKGQKRGPRKPKAPVAQEG